MRFAYADPPYPGLAKRHYGDHPDFEGEVDHGALIARLEDEFPDGWALSTSEQALQEVLPLCPPKLPGVRGRRYLARSGVRILAWVKPMAPPLGRGPTHSWEPVIMRGGRGLSHPVKDVLVVSPEQFTWRRRPDDHVIGAKPPAFCRWLFACMGAGPGDEFVDLFPGSGAVAREWAIWERQPNLLGASL
jgi:hypothetical protein